MSDVNATMRALTGTVAGRVQGVGFRLSTRFVADRLGVSGWVRNLADGRVEVFIQGNATAVAAMEEWLRDGPRAARVDRVALSDVDIDHTLRDFGIR